MPLSVQRFGLRGKVVTMHNGQVVQDGVVWVDTASGKIKDVRNASAGPPGGFAQATLIDTGGTIFPGLIELHNHLAYNILTLWKVPQKYGHRDQWPNHDDYIKLIRGPAHTLGVAHAGTYLPAMVRWVEAKCLAGGVTTSQGITLKNSSGLRSNLRGNVRNVETNGTPNMPAARARIGDLNNGEADEFLEDLKNVKCLLLHLSEGASGNPVALRRFERLQRASGDEWAITASLAGIHSAALEADELELLQQGGAAIVWSPMSNLLLYGTTADVQEAKRLGIRIGIGSDWSPTGSKNLLGELKLARLVSRDKGDIFTDEEIVQMATSTAADILGWDQVLGRIQPDFFADLLVVEGQQANPYKQLIECRETDIMLVAINGAPRYGQAAVMNQLVNNAEARSVDGQQFAFDFERFGNPMGITLAAAEQTLKNGLDQLPDLALQAPDGGISGNALQGTAMATGAAGGAAGLTLDLSDDADAGFLSAADLMQVYRTMAEPLTLDPLTVADDANYFTTLAAQQPHVPAFIKNDLQTLY